MTEPKTMTEAVLGLLDEQLALHQGYSAEAKNKGFAGLAAYYDTMSLGIVECIRSIRTNRLGETTQSWRTTQASEQPTIANEHSDGTHS